MTRLIRTTIVACLTLGSLGCGYTILAPERRPLAPEKGGAIEPPPDLSFGRIAMAEHEVRDNNGRPRHVTVFRITIRNDGVGDFTGSILCAFACNEGDIQHSQYPGHASPIAAMLRHGDTTQVVLRIDQRFARGTNIRFKIRTDAHPLHEFDPAFFFGREPIRESSYEDNGVDYIVK